MKKMHTQFALFTFKRYYDKVQKRTKKPPTQRWAAFLMMSFVVALKNLRTE